MCGEKIFKSKVLALGVIGAFLLLLFPAEAWTQTAGGTGTIQGFIFQEDMRTPLENAVVKIRNTKDGLEKESPPTDGIGAYEIKDVKEGRYLLGVSNAGGDYNFDYMISIKANETAKLSMAVKPGASPAAGQAGAAAGAAAGGGFFSTTAGILLLIAAGGLLTLGVITLVTPADTASPSAKKKKK